MATCALSPRMSILRTPQFRSYAGNSLSAPALSKSTPATKSYNQPTEQENPHGTHRRKPRKPVEKFTEGNVHVSIWENEGPKGAFRTASMQLRYKDKSSDEWKTGASYSASDLKNLEKAAQEARRRIETWQQQNKPAPQNAA